MRSSRITTNEIAPYGGRIIDSLHGDIVGSDQVVEIVEEGRANQVAYVAKLDRTSREDDGDRFASDAGGVSELVALDVQVALTFAEGCAGGTPSLETLGMGNVDRNGVDG